MSFRALPLPSDCTGALWLTAMPGRQTPWPDFVLQAEQHQIRLVVCLTTQVEMAGLSPAYAHAVHNRQAPFEQADSWMLLPASNMGPPAEPARFRQGIAQIARRARAGDAVLLHCAAGIGRTGTAAACILKCLGLSSADALAQVRAAGSNPQNALQSGVVEWF